ncbi:hypothetical protein AB0K51_01590 [Kitasatospora sp. NPDC049285]|uniref:hypothetical protein n=1 Tax=Kitasatospora sp. NPDC049285 TaxID=3157096 RepID=UPI00342C9F0A
MDAVHTLAWRYVAWQVMPEELPMAAAELLAAGYDSPALCDLAGRARREETGVLQALLEAAVGELGVGLPTVGRAERYLLRDLALRLLSGAATALEVAAAVSGVEGEDADDLELRFLRVAGGECCTRCLTDVQLYNPEAYAAWETDLRTAAAEL